MKFNRQEKHDMVDCIKTELEEMIGDLFQPQRDIKTKILIALQELEFYD